jgi:ArsR family transcriptional regulator, arsenate/arsenite/antimonite-responsive transcriptional repressor
MYALSMTSRLFLRPSPKKLAHLAEQYKALGDSTRLGLMLKVAASADDEACICDLTPDTNLAQSTVSHHMKILVDAGLLTRTQRGKWAFFALTEDATVLLRNFL